MSIVCITLFRYITMFFGTYIIMWIFITFRLNCGIICRILLVPHVAVMDLNNVMEEGSTMEFYNGICAITKWVSILVLKASVIIQVRCFIPVHISFSNTLLELRYPHKVGVKH